MPYLCPACGRLPHWSAVVIASAALPRRGDETLNAHTARLRGPILDLSADLCTDREYADRETGR